MASLASLIQSALARQAPSPSRRRDTDVDLDRRPDPVYDLGLREYVPVDARQPDPTAGDTLTPEQLQAIWLGTKTARPTGVVQDAPLEPPGLEALRELARALPGTTVEDGLPAEWRALKERFPYAPAPDRFSRHRGEPDFALASGTPKDIDVSLPTTFTGNADPVELLMHELVHVGQFRNSLTEDALSPKIDKDDRYPYSYGPVEYPAWGITQGNRDRARQHRTPSKDALARAIWGS